LNRLLFSIKQANFEGYNDITLIISIDKTNCLEVLAIAEKFIWEHGSKKVILHKEHMGLRKHVISCGDLTEKYGAVIVLEDDLYVSPAFYDYAVQAMRFYSDCYKVGGISLYGYDFNEYARLGFHPIDDGYDNYFIQSPSSWGQLWTQRQWRGFRKWYNANAQLGVNAEDRIPDNVIKWPESSWKKYFIKYMMLEGKYFVYPRTSLTTNFGDIGVHHKGQSTFQVPLLLTSKEYNFSDLKSSLSVYDNHYEIEAYCIKSLNPNIKNFDFECDFYGTKSLEKVEKRYLLSVRDCANAIRSYALDLLPQELNVTCDVRGNFFHLGGIHQFTGISQAKRFARIVRLHKDLGTKQYVGLLVEKLLRRVVQRPAV